MGGKRTAILLLVIFLLPLALITGARTESRLVWSFDLEGFDVEVYAPYQAYAGDTITMAVRTEAKKDLRDVSVEIRLYGSKLDGYDTWTRNISVLDGERLPNGVVLDQNFNVSVPSDVSPGLIYGHAYCNWKVGKTYFYLPWELNDSFIITYLKNKAYEDLQVAHSDLLNDYHTLLANYSALLDYYNSLSADYISLNSTYYDLLGTYNQLQSDYNNLQESYDILDNNYNNLQTNYDSLHAKWEDLKSKDETSKANLGTTWNLNYLLMITTIIFIATTAYLAIRKTKVKPKLETT